MINYHVYYINNVGVGLIWWVTGVDASAKEYIREQITAQELGWV